MFQMTSPRASTRRHLLASSADPTPAALLAKNQGPAQLGGGLEDGCAPMRTNAGGRTKGQASRCRRFSMTSSSRGADEGGVDFGSGLQVVRFRPRHRGARCACDMNNSRTPGDRRSCWGRPRADPLPPQGSSRSGGVIVCGGQHARAGVVR